MKLSQDTSASEGHSTKMNVYTGSDREKSGDIVNINNMIPEMSKEELRELYSKLRNEREKTTFSMMMKMNPEALTAVRKEFFMREDKVELPEFIYIIQKHLSGGTSGIDDDLYTMQTNEKREFGLNMCELFKEIDVNGDGDLEWQEFTQFVVEKANILNKRLRMTSISHYSQNTNLVDSTSTARHRHDATSMIDIAPLGLIALVEDHKSQIFLLHANTGQYIQNSLGDIKTDAAPIAIAYIEENHTLVASLSNMTMCSYSLDHPNPNKKFKTLSTWATPGVQMAVTYMEKNKLLYSGATNGDIYSWKIKERKISDTLIGHNDLVMSLVTLPRLNYLASASLDKIVAIWDVYTNQQLLKLSGHKKGILDIDYSSDYRLLISAGFEHDAFIWSPFVNSLVFRLKGHLHSLVGCQAIKGTPEIITADTSGVLKLWDIRNFQCVQSFDTNSSGQEMKDGSKLGCFLQCNLPNKGSNNEDDSRIYAASKSLFAFDQMRVVHDATTDYSNILFMTWNQEHMTIITASERNIMIWDALVGSKTTTVNNICGHEISACCLDDRKRKIVIGDVTGSIAVYNAASGGFMKATCHNNFFVVVALQYIDNVRRFIAAYKNGVMRLYDESGLEDCHLLLTFETAHGHLEVLNMVFNSTDYTIATIGASSDSIILWDYYAGKLEQEIEVCDESEHVVQIICLTPYPIICSSDSVGNVLLFGSRGCTWSGKRISGFMNQIPLSAEYEEVMPLLTEEEERPLRAMILSLQNTSPSSPIIQSNKPNRRGRLKSDRGSIGSIGKLKLKSMSSGSSTNSVEKMEKNMSKSRGERGSVGSLSTTGNWSRRGSVFSDIGNNESDSDDGDEETEDWQNTMNFFNRKATEESVRSEFVESEKKWGKVTPAQAMGWDGSTMQMYTADALGNLRSFCLKDVMTNMRRTFDLKRKTNPRKSSIGDLCRRTPHNALSAMPPYPQKGKTHLLGLSNDATSYIGVKFNWSIEAHNACIINCKAIPDGVLTSAADKLVKMWSFDGLPLGVLIQSVPIGMKSRLWFLKIDVEPAMIRESLELDNVINKVHELVINTHKPELDEFDFYGIEPGENSTTFSRSELRQRIEKTSVILGVDFSINSSEKEFTDFTETSLAKLSPITFDGTTDLEKFNDDRDGENVKYNLKNRDKDKDAIKDDNNDNNNYKDNKDSNKDYNKRLHTASSTPNTNTNTIKTKTYNSALHELKSGEASVDFKSRNHGLSKLQIRRKATKMEEISYLFEMKTGIKISLDDSGTVARSDLSKTFGDDGVEYRASSSVRAKHGHQKAIKSNKVFIIENNQDTGLGNLLNMNGNGQKREGCSSSSSLMGSCSSTPVRRGSIDGIEMEYQKKKMLRELGPKVTQALSSSLQLNTRKGNNDKNDNRNDHYQYSKSYPNSPNGNMSLRSISMNEAFGTFNKLENLLLSPSSSNKRVLPLHPEDLEKLNKFRDNKKLLLEKVLKNNSNLGCPKIIEEF